MEISVSHKVYVCAVATAVGFGTVFYFYHKRKLGVSHTLKNLNIITITTEEQCDDVVSQLRRQCTKLRALGFDCEWVTVNGKRKPVALLQLSSHNGLCGLFRLNCMKTVFPSLKNLLEEETIYKVGVAAADDSKYLFQDYGVSMKSTLDVRHLAELNGCDTGGLASLSMRLLGVTLDKSWRIRCSDWEAKELSYRQTQYAAIDAHVAIRIFKMLVEQLGTRNMRFPWVRRHYDVWDDLDKHCAKFGDIKYRAKTKPKIKPDTTGKDIEENKEALANRKQYSHATRTRPLYQNCLMQALDGQLLCTCDEKKALWYVNKGLADLIEKNPLTVRLRFEPAGRPVGEVGRYYQQAKDNKCVVCARESMHIRKNVVPREYRKYFPEIMKDHSSHDVVLLCSACHQASNMRDQAVRERLAARCGAPLPALNNTKYSEDAATKKVKSAARALMYQSKKHILPEARRKELEDILLTNYPQYDEVTEELLQEAAELQVLYENSSYESHGQKVVEYYLKNGGLLLLEELWRQHFLDSMNPEHMPMLWSVKHNEERLRVKWNERRLTQDDLKSIGLTTL